MEEARNFTLDQLTGRTRSHLAELPVPACALHRDVVSPFLTLRAAAAIEAASLHTYTAELAHTDGLTGLANRRLLDQDLALECERAERSVRSGDPSCSVRQEERDRKGRQRVVDGSSR